MPVVISIANSLNVIFQSDLKSVKTYFIALKYVSIIVAMFVSNVNILFKFPELKKVSAYCCSIPFSSTENRVLQRTRFLF